MLRKGILLLLFLFLFFRISDSMSKLITNPLLKSFLNMQINMQIMQLGIKLIYLVFLFARKHGIRREFFDTSSCY